MKTLHGPWCAALVLSMLVAPGCGGGGDPASNTMEINGSVSPITAAHVRHAGEWRLIELQNAAGHRIQLQFEGQGDPLLAENEVPLGAWTAMDASFDMVTVIDGEGGRSYGPGNTYGGSMRVGGIPGSKLAVEASWEFTSGAADALRVSYAGPYDYLAE